jgi:hypothetical protein
MRDIGFASSATACSVLAPVRVLAPPNPECHPLRGFDIQWSKLLPSSSKKALQKAGLFYWLGLCNLFQTYEGLDDGKDKQAEIQAVRNLLAYNETQGL